MVDSGESLANYPGTVGVLSFKHSLLFQQVHSEAGISPIKAPVCCRGSSACSASPGPSRSEVTKDYRAQLEAAAQQGPRQGYRCGRRWVLAALLLSKFLIGHLSY